MANIAVALRLLNDNLELQKWTIEKMLEAAHQTGCSLFFYATNRDRYEQLVGDGEIDPNIWTVDPRALIKWCDALYVRNIGGQRRKVGELARMAMAAGKQVFDPYIARESRNNHPAPKSKLDMGTALQANEVPTPEQRLITWEELCDLPPDELYGKVVKVNRGGRQGRGTYMMRRLKGKDKIAMVLDDLFFNHHLSLGHGILVQEWIKAKGGDWRVMVVHGEVIGVFRRGKRKKTFQATTSEGKSKNVPLNQVPSGLKAICERAADVLGLSICSIDAIMDANNNFHIIEVNEAPSFRAFMSKTKTNPMVYLFNGIKGAKQ